MQLEKILLSREIIYSVCACLHVCSVLTLSGSAGVIEFALELLDYQFRLGFRLQKGCFKCPHLLLRPVYGIFASKVSGFEMSQRSPSVMMCGGVGVSEQQAEV